MVFETLELEQKREILRRVLHSPQFSQSLASLTVALRDGGLPSISEALRIKVENGGFMRRGGVPLGGGDAVEAFLEGVKKEAKEGDDGDEMDTQ
jgi:26S proteasome regulatory subunit N13